MKIGLNVDENLKTLFDEISSLEYLDIEVDECKLDDIDIIIIDTRKEKLNEYLTKYKQKGILIIALVGGCKSLSTEKSAYKTLFNR